MYEPGLPTRLCVVTLYISPSHSNTQMILKQTMSILVALGTVGSICLSAAPAQAWLFPLFRAAAMNVAKQEAIAIYCKKHPKKCRAKAVVKKKKVVSKTKIKPSSSKSRIKRHRSQTARTSR
jgi:hypothetical protein